FSPYWNVTRRIKELELDPERAKDPLHYEKNGYEVMERGTPREWVREMPGPGNSLGFVKFIFPNPHATFVHDTPQKELFRQPVRAFSHGCMRLEEPLQLARQLLREDGQWDEQAYQVRYQSWQSMSFASLKESYDPERYETLRQRATELERNIYLGRPVPVHVEYYTVRVDDAGQVQFLADIYGYDEQLLNPKPPKKCTPEGKSARWSFKRIPEKLAEYQRDAVRLVPEILATAEKAKKLQAKGTWLERRLLKEAKKIDNFMAQHENYAKSIQEAHDQLARALAERDGRWNKRLEEEAVRLQRLLRGLAQMNAKARQLCQQVEQAVSSK
ncbi:MAG: hypothetical protein FJ125_03040, partial [Deltaproteobacteria bacterium]|nr:hypothetical protein [Deltaproteobacteria bacterium]